MNGFQSSATEVEATVQNAAVVLCNDKPQTFGAPDVLQVTAGRVSARYTTSMFFPDRPPNQALQVGLAMSASFLNNSSSRWEAMCESWTVEGELVDIVSPIYRSDHHRYAFCASAMTYHELHLQMSTDENRLQHIYARHMWRWNFSYMEGLTAPSCLICSCLCMTLHTGCKCRAQTQKTGICVPVM